MFNSNDTRSERIVNWKAEALRERKELVNGLKDNPCTDCGLKFHPCAMEWDHVRGTKTRAVATMVRGCEPIDRILAEIAKCELVCANCHALRHEYRRVMEKHVQQ